MQLLVRKKLNVKLIFPASRIGFAAPPSSGIYNK